MSGFVRKSACCSSHSTWMGNDKTPRHTSSLKNWCRTSMCFKFEVYTGFCASCLAPSFSSKTVMHVVTKPGEVEFRTHRKNITSLSLTVSANAKHNLNSFCQCYVLGFGRRKRSSLVRHRKPACACTSCAHHSPTRG